MARVVVVGAGPAGLAGLRALAAAGLDAVAYERHSRIGGVWSLGEEQTAAYGSLHLITSRERTEFAEHPMPPGTPDYPARDAVGAWLEDYADRFDLRSRIVTGEGVVAARRLEGGSAGHGSSASGPPAGGWELELESGATASADVLVVASGHNGEPLWPNPPYPGEFAGEQLHAFDYGDASAFAGRNVLVVGMGNSAMDIASDLSLVAARTLLSVRRGSWVVPKRLLGKPADQVVSPWAAVHVPWRLRQPLAELLLRASVGSPERYGLPKPPVGLFQDHPTITDTVLSRIAHGRLEPRGAIAALEGDSVRFADGASDAVDAIVWCTGYRVAIPFLDDVLVGPDPRELPLYQRVFPLDGASDLFYVGLMQSTGSAFPILERQAGLVAERLTGRWAPPSPAEMRRHCARIRKRAAARWGEHGRPAMRVDFDGYMHALSRELEVGRARAAAANGNSAHSSSSAGARAGEAS